MDQEKIKTAAQMLIEGIGEDPAREGLGGTPERIARMYEELCGGYDADVAQILSRTFEAKDAEMVTETGIPFYSLCEHHMLPFFGQAHIAYLPDGKVVGLSKLARTVDVFARRLQIQENMTSQIAEAIMSNLHPKGVMVMLEAEHLCMTMRGIKKPGTQTVTVKALGVFEEDPGLQDRFYRMIRKGS